MPPDATTPPPGGERFVLFDFGHTLVDFRRVPAALFAAYGEIRSRLVEEAHREVPETEDLARQITDAMDALVRRSYMEGRIQELDVVELLTEAFAGIGVHLSAALARELAALDHRAFSGSISVAEATIGVLEALRDRGVGMGLVSNITLLPDLLRGDLEALGLAPFLSATAFSSEFGWRKPDRRIFEHVLQRLGARPAQAAFVGDRLYDDIGGARQVGMRTVLTRQFRNELDGAERGEALAAGGAAVAALAPDAAIDTIEDLPSVLAGWGWWN